MLFSAQRSWNYFRCVDSVTAVIPCYNAAPFLAEALGSVRAQTQPVADLIVVDDGSTDGTSDIARALGARLLLTGGRQGPSRARNLGARAAQTALVAFLDADDLWLPPHCALLRTALASAPEAAMAFGRIQMFGSAGDIPTPRRSPEHDEAALPELLIDNPIPQSATMVRREVFQELGGYREDMRFAEDYDLWLRMAERYRIVALHKITCRLRIHPAQAHRARRPMLEGTWTARFASRDRLRAAGTYTGVHETKLVGALADDAAFAWNIGDRPSLEFLLGVASQLNDADRIASDIARKLPLLPWRRVVGAVKRLLGRH